jgi:hypothetical protein
MLTIVYHLPQNYQLKMFRSICNVCLKHNKNTGNFINFRKGVRRWFWELTLNNWLIKCILCFKLFFKKQEKVKKLLKS